MEPTSNTGRWEPRTGVCRSRGTARVESSERSFAFGERAAARSGDARVAGATQQDEPFFGSKCPDSDARGESMRASCGAARAACVLVQLLLRPLHSSRHAVFVAPDDNGWALRTSPVGLPAVAALLRAGQRAGAARSYIGRCRPFFGSKCHVQIVAFGAAPAAWPAMRWSSSPASRSVLLRPGVAHEFGASIGSTARATRGGRTTRPTSTHKCVRGARTRVRRSWAAEVEL